MLRPDQFWSNRLRTQTVMLLFEQVFVSSSLRAVVSSTADAQMVRIITALWLFDNMESSSFAKPRVPKKSKEKNVFTLYVRKLKEWIFAKLRQCFFTSQSQLRYGFLPISEVPNSRKISNISNTSGESLSCSNIPGIFGNKYFPLFGPFCSKTRWTCRSRAR